MAQKMSVQPGDRFEKVGTFRTVWVVKRLLDLPDLPPHIHIVPEVTQRPVLTFSISAVCDKRHFRPLAVG
jgi:hypothetical protein